MSYTDHPYLNQMIEIAIQDGTVTEKEVISVTGRYGNNDDNVAIDLISVVYQRRKDRSTTHERMQKVYRDHKNGII